jgi:hypothetical protein
MIIVTVPIPDRLTDTVLIVVFRQDDRHRPARCSDELQATKA